MEGNITSAEIVRTELEVVLAMIKEGAISEQTTLACVGFTSYCFHAYAESTTYFLSMIYIHPVAIVYAFYEESMMLMLKCWIMLDHYDYPLMLDCYAHFIMLWQCSCFG